MGSAVSCQLAILEKWTNRTGPSLALRVRLSQRERPTAGPPISLSGSSLPPGETHARNAAVRTN